MATDWIQTNENRALFPRAITKESVGSIREIAHSLAHCYRFNRQTEQPYSVAEHCVRGSRLLPPAFAGAFLLHELSEVYLPDIPAPLKPFLSVEIDESPSTIKCSNCGTGADPGCVRCEGRAAGAAVTKTWPVLEQEHTHVILDALGLSSLEPLIYSREVRAMDLAMLAAEKRDLVGPEPMPWGLEVAPACSTEIVPWRSEIARGLFIDRFSELFQVGR